MNIFSDQIIHELTKEYMINNFDFKASSPEALAKFYKETYSKIENILKETDSFIYSADN